MRRIFTFFHLLLLVPLIVVSSCTKDPTTNSLELYYYSISDIGPSMSASSGTPSYYGGTPTDFAIYKVELDGVSFADYANYVSINSTTGSISIGNSDNLEVGLYSVSVSCQAAGSRLYFDNIFEFKMLSAVPSAIVVTPSILTIALEDILSNETTAQVTIEEESVSVRLYSLEQASGKEYFTISNEGVIGINSEFNGEFIAGVYTPTINIDTYAGSMSYDNLLQITITSPPYDLSYYPNSVEIEVDNAFESVVPQLLGSTDELKFEIYSVTPTTDKFSISSTTGVISIGEDNGLQIGDEYKFSIFVSNDVGDRVFNDVYTILIVDEIEPIDPDTFSYEDIELTQNIATTINKEAGFVGDQVIFSLKDLPTGAEGATIDATNGDISIDNTLDVGIYTITVNAKSAKSDYDTTFTITVVENPNYFTFVSYGNNLGLDTSVHASQYMVESENAFNLIDLTPTTDAKAGVELKYSMTGLRNATNWTINSSTGVITLGDYKGASECSAVLVTTTAGYGTDTEVSVSTPVFFYYATGKDGVKVKYTPFVFKVNPKSGGRMEIIPELDGYTDDKSYFLMDFRRTFSYYNIGGPESHISGTIGTSDEEKARFISLLWEKYYTDHTTRAVNYGGKSPMSWYNNQIDRTSGTDGSDSIVNALGYVDAADLSIVVNPNKWIYDGVYANGIFTAQMLFVTNGTASDIDSATTYIFPIWIWFDEKF